MIRVLIVDDDALVRTGLALMLGGQERIEVVGEAPDGRAAVARVREAATTQHRVDVVLMDIRMPVLDGIAATAELRHVAHPPRVIVLTTFDADDYVVRALVAGADGFLLKDTPPAQIVEAIERVVEGEPILSPRVTAGLIRQVTDAAPDHGNEEARRRLERLTEREREVAVCVGHGRSNAEIATELHMSLATVKAHISHIFTKLEATNRVQVAIAMHAASPAGT